MIKLRKSQSAFIKISLLYPIASKSVTALRCYRVNVDERLQQLVESMPQIINAILKATGGPTSQQDVTNEGTSGCILSLRLLIHNFSLCFSL